jgi:ADP-heptose:LPS heptosyltransferase
MRFSALGDVALSIPALYPIAVEHPDDEFLVLSKNVFAPLFEVSPANVRVIPVFTRQQHKGIRGLWRLVRELTSLRIDCVADLHRSLRSRAITLYFRLKGVKTACIDKGKSEKQALTRERHKRLVPLKPSFERYRDVFNKLGYTSHTAFGTLYDFGERDFGRILPFTGPKTGRWIGIAPFARHAGKTYPPELTERVIALLSAQPDITIFLFGGADETDLPQQWQQQFPQVISVAGRFPLQTELLLMSYLDVLLTMDSGNMHLASLVGIRAVSVWGATHPFAGFCGYGQQPEDCIQLDLPCRPCSVFGKKPCRLKSGKYGCLRGIEPERIALEVSG